MKNWKFLIFTLLVFSTDLNASVKKNNPVLKLPVKEIDKEKAEAGLVIGEKLTQTSEAGAIATIDIRLQKQPIADVEIKCRSLDKREGKVSSDPLIFTKNNWNKSQQCTVVGQDDHKVDGDRRYNIIIDVTSKKDMEYDRMTPYSITLLNRDNDQAGIVVKKSGLTTSEEGKTASLWISLSSQPAAEVVIPLKSDNISEGLVRPHSISFAPESWNKPQKVLITGQDDAIADGLVSYAVIPGPVKSEDPQFHDLKLKPIQMQNIDNDQAAVLVSSPSRLTDESGGETSISVSLHSKPVDKVIIRVSSSNVLEGGANPRVLSFTPQNWNKPQRIRVVGNDDSIDDGDTAFEIIISSKKSSDKTYSKLADQSLRFINADDDQSGFVVNKKNTQTTEAGGLGKISLKLTSKPRARVTLNFRSGDPSEGRLLLKTFSFTEEDWFQEKTITVIGVDDVMADGDQPYWVIIEKPETEDPLYAAIDPDDIEMVNIDDEKTGLTINSSGKVTSEAGDSVDLSIRLNARPTSEVTLTLESSDKTEGEVTPGILKFNPDDWDQPKIVSVAGLPDGLVDGDRPYEIVITSNSDDPIFNGSPPSVSLKNEDINTYAILHRLSDPETTEQGKESSIFLKLDSNPGEILTIVVQSEDESEGNVFPDSLVFTDTNWQEEQQVTIKGVDDDIKDGLQSYRLKVFAQGTNGFSAAPPLYVELRNIDDDKEGITVKQLSHVTSEETDHAEFSIKLNSEPASSVIFIFSTTDQTEGKMLDYHAAFFPDNWYQEQVIRVGCARDYVVDGTQTFQVTSQGGISKDPNYNKMAFPSLDMICHDNDKAGFIVGNVEGKSTENGSEALFNLKLKTKPSSPVRIGLNSDDESEGIANPSHLVFDAENWNKGHNVTITGQNDNEKDGDTDFHILFNEAESGDPDYQGLVPNPVQVTNHDNMTMVFGTTITRFEFRDAMKDKLDESFAIGVFGAYVYSRNLDLDVAVYSFSSEGDNVVHKYNVDNPMTYRLDYNSIIAGIRYAFWRSLLTTYARGGAEMAYWNLDSSNNLSGSQDKNTGTSLGLYAGLGADVSVIGGFILALEWSYHFVSRGLGNNRSTFAIKYPY